MAGHIFISYSRADRSYVDRLVVHLTGAGFPVWYDYGIETGQRFAEVIQRQIVESAVCLAVMSPEAAASTWVNREISYADHLRRPILPLLLRPCTLPILVHDLDHEDVTHGGMPGDRLTARLRQLLPPDRPARSPRREALAQRIEQVTFSAPAPGLRGYDERGVDDFLDQVIAQLETQPLAMTPADVVDSAFYQPRDVATGYDEKEVDDFLDHVERELTLIIEEEGTG